MRACRKQLLQKDKNYFSLWSKKTQKPKTNLNETHKQTYPHCISGEEIPPGMKQNLKNFWLVSPIRLKNYPAVLELLGIDQKETQNFIIKELISSVYFKRRLGRRVCTCEWNLNMTQLFCLACFLKQVFIYKVLRKISFNHIYRF